MRFYKYYAFFLFALCIGGLHPGHAQGNIDPFTRGRTVLDSTLNYLGAIKAVDSLKDSAITPSQKQMFFQAAATFNTFLLNNVNYHQIIEPLLTKDIPHYPITEKKEEIIAKLIERCGDRQVIMVRELHWYSSERYFTNLLLKDLHSKGFRYLAIEALWTPGKDIAERGYPIQSDGLYVCDPRMANMIRDALEIGYTLVEYDDFSRNREEMQAKNIIEKTLAKDPHAKIVVQAGGSHSFKSPESKMMGYYFQEISGIKPYVIHQVVYMNNKNPLSGLSIAEPSNTQQKNCDILVVNAMQEGDYKYKPHKKQKQHRFVTAIPEKYFAKSYADKTFLSIYNEMEYKAYGLRAIPVAAYVINSTIEDQSFPLPKGKYHITIRGISGKILEEFPL